jgi:23S rRNA pseudouridine1911/1915/1917 synthase
VTKAHHGNRHVVRRSGVRVDRFLAEAEACGRRAARRAIAEGRVRIDNRLARAADTPQIGATVTVDAPLPEGPPAPAQTSARPPQILWDDGNLLAVAKPAGFHTHAGDREPSVAGWLSDLRPEFRSIGERGVESGIAHRLDRDTSGVLVATANAGTYLKLREWFARHAIIKRYLALTTGQLPESAIVDRALARRRTRVVPARRRDRCWPARTEFQRLSGTAEWSLVQALMCTGVTHQVRAHAALAGHPLLGDFKYGGPPSPAGTRAGVLLHAWSIALPNGLQITAAVPEDFLKALAELRNSGSRSA